MTVQQRLLAQLCTCASCCQADPRRVAILRARLNAYDLRDLRSRSRENSRKSHKTKRRAA